MLSLAKKSPSDITEGPILSNVILFTIPIILTSVLQLLFNTADTVVVGRWGGETEEAREIALAAVGSCGSLINLILGLFIGLSLGAGVTLAHDVGARDSGGIEKTLHTSVFTALICGTVVTLIGLPLAPSLLALMKCDPQVLDAAVPYIRAYFLGVPALTIYTYCASLLRSSGDTTHPLIFLSVSGVINIILNLITVLIFHMGALGVGIATAASQWVSCILILLFMLRTDGPCHLDLKKLRINASKLKKILMIGLPAGLQSTLFAFSNVITQSAINSLGKIVVAGNTAAMNLDTYVYNVQNAFYQTTLTFVGQHVGARKYGRLKRCVLVCAASVIVTGIVAGVGVYLLGEPLLNLFAPGNDAVISAGMIRLLWVCVPYFLCGLMELATGVERGLGHSIFPMLVSLMGACLLRVAWILTVFRAIPTLHIVYASYPITWTITATVLFIHILVFFRRLPHPVQAPRVPVANAPRRKAIPRRHAVRRNLSAKHVVIASAPIKTV